MSFDSDEIEDPQQPGNLWFQTVGTSIWEEVRKAYDFSRKYAGNTGNRPGYARFSSKPLFMATLYRRLDESTPARDGITEAERIAELQTAMPHQIDNIVTILRDHYYQYVYDVVIKRYHALYPKYLSDYQAGVLPDHAQVLLPNPKSIEQEASGLIAWFNSIPNKQFDSLDRLVNFRREMEKLLTDLLDRLEDTRLKFSDGLKDASALDREERLLKDNRRLLYATASMVVLTAAAIASSAWFSYLSYKSNSVEQAINGLESSVRDLACTLEYAFGPGGGDQLMLDDTTAQPAGVESSDASESGAENTNIDASDQSSNCKIMSAGR